MTKIFNFSLKIKGVVGRVAHAKSSDHATPKKKNWNVNSGEKIIKKKEKSSGTGTNFHLAVEKGCVQ